MGIMLPSLVLPKFSTTLQFVSRYRDPQLLVSQTVLFILKPHIALIKQEFYSKYQLFCRLIKQIKAIIAVIKTKRFI